jgi:hypothetical protein
LVYKEHQVFEKPTDENTRIWRYLDFTKFVSLLDRQALFFTRVDKLGDAFEGSSSKADILLRINRENKLKQQLPKTIINALLGSKNIGN